MDLTEEEQKKIILIWKNASKLLEEIRRNEIKNCSTPKELMCLRDAFESALFLYKPKDTSGLVEQQKYFMKWKQK